MEIQNELIKSKEQINLLRFKVEVLIQMLAAEEKKFETASKRIEALKWYIANPNSSKLESVESDFLGNVRSLDISEAISKMKLVFSTSRDLVVQKFLDPQGRITMCLDKQNFVVILMTIQGFKLTLVDCELLAFRFFDGSFVCIPEFLNFFLSSNSSKLASAAALSVRNSCAVAGGILPTLGCDSPLKQGYVGLESSTLDKIFRNLALVWHEREKDIVSGFKAVENSKGLVNINDFKQVLTENCSEINSDVDLLVERFELGGYCNVKQFCLFISSLASKVASGELAELGNSPQLSGSLRSFLTGSISEWAQLKSSLSSPQRDYSPTIELVDNKVEVKALGNQLLALENNHSFKVESNLVEAPKVESKPIEAPKVESKPVEAPKVESKPIEAPKVESKPIEAPKVESKSIEAPKVESKPVDASLAILAADPPKSPKKVQIQEPAKETVDPKKSPEKSGSKATSDSPVALIAPSSPSTSVKKDKNPSLPGSVLKSPPKSPGLLSGLKAVTQDMPSAEEPVKIELFPDNPPPKPRKSVVLEPVVVENKPVKPRKSVSLEGDELKHHLPQEVIHDAVNKANEKNSKNNSAGTIRKGGLHKQASVTSGEELLVLEELKKNELSVDVSSVNDTQNLLLEEYMKDPDAFEEIIRTKATVPPRMTINVESFERALSSQYPLLSVDIAKTLEKISFSRSGHSAEFIISRFREIVSEYAGPKYSPSRKSPAPGSPRGKQEALPVTSNLSAPTSSASSPARSPVMDEKEKLLDKEISALKDLLDSTNRVIWKYKNTNSQLFTILETAIVSKRPATKKSFFGGLVDGYLTKDELYELLVADANDNIPVTEIRSFVVNDMGSSVSSSGRILMTDIKKVVRQLSSVTLKHMSELDRLEAKKIKRANMRHSEESALTKSNSSKGWGIGGYLFRG